MSCLRHRHVFFALVLVSLSLVAGGAAQLANSRASLSTAAANFLATLDADQRAKVLLPYEAPQRLDWHFIPKAERKGLQIKHMNEGQRTAALALLRASLSEAGYTKGTKIMALEKAIAFLERNKKGGAIRDSERYYFTLFGEPKGDAKWGLSCEGHHLSLNFVMQGDRIASSSPAMLGANPAIVQDDYPDGPAKHERVLAQEELLAFELVTSLAPEALKVALLADKAPAEMRGAGAPQPPVAKAEGLAAGKMTAEQQSLLRKLISTYTENMPAETAAENWKRIEGAGFEGIHFAWAGATKPGIGHYYRVQGPTFLIEFVNTQPDAAGNPANHIHCMWRDMAGDFALPLAGQ